MTRSTAKGVPTRWVYCRSILLLCQLVLLISHSQIPVVVKALWITPSHQQFPLKLSLDRVRRYETPSTVLMRHDATAGDSAADENMNSNSNNNDEQKNVAPTRRYTSSSWSSFHDSSKLDEKERMDIVRSLQSSFYKTASSSAMSTITKALEEECGSSQVVDDVVDDDNTSDTVDECILLDTDSPESILDVTDVRFRNKPATQRILDPHTGKVMNLPLWRVQWTEVPYRTNILSVHEPMYTNMFEEILRSDNSESWYVGHLYLPGGSNSLRLQRRQQEDSYTNEDVNNNLNIHRMSELKSWKNWQHDDDEQSAVVGTLLRITDYRRLEDGKLLLFVQALHRFVVTDVQQSLPYGIAHVQLLPDSEEFTFRETEHPQVQLLEANVNKERSDAIQESFHRWHRYEFDETKLPLKPTNFISLSDVDGSLLLKMVPFAFFAKMSSLSFQNYDSPNRSPTPNSSTITTDLCLEHELVQRRILKEPDLYQKSTIMRLSVDDLEIRLWLALNDYAKSTRKPIPLVLLELLPNRMNWPKTFVLNDIVRTMEKLQPLQIQQKTITTEATTTSSSTTGNVSTDKSYTFQRVSKEYPSIRRQQRLSYHAAQLLEDSDDTESKNQLRQTILQIPSI